MAISQLDVPVQLLQRPEGLFVPKRHSRTAGSKPYAFTLDVPITESDVTRWGLLFDRSAPPPLAPNAAFIGGGFVDPATVLAMRDDDERRRAVHKLAPMRLFDSQRVGRVSMTKTLMHRRKWLPYRQRIPIYQYRGPLLDALISRQVVALIAPPGTGRTLQVPQIIAETEVFKSKRIILLSQTSATAQRTAMRLREERGEDAVATAIGVCTRELYAVTEDTVIAVTTAEMLARQLLCDPLLLNVGCVIIDDVHLRSPTTELCLALLRLTLRALRDEQPNDRCGGSLRVVLNCPEEAVAVSMTDFFGEDCTARVSLHQDTKTPDAQNLDRWGLPSVLYLEETIQWLARCETEGSMISRDPAEDLKHYVENIAVMARIMAADEAEFTNEERLRSYWCPIITRAVREYDCADRRELIKQQKQGKEQFSAVVIVVPNAHSASVVAAEMNSCGDEENPLTVRCLFDDTTAEELSGAIDFASKLQGSRMVFILTPLLAQCALPSTFPVGLVVDCARHSYMMYDANTDADVMVTEFSTTHELRHRRGIARVRLSSVETEEEHSQASMVLQLITKNVLYSAKHRRITNDSGHHAIFHSSWDEYVRFYHLLKAHEEALHCREVYTSVTTVNPNSNLNGYNENHGVYGNGLPSVAVSQVLSAILIGAPPASSNRYESLRRIFASVESYLLRNGHLEPVIGESDKPSRLSPLGVAATCLALPVAVVRLMIFSCISGCIVPASVVAATWMTGDLFNSGCVNADAETQQLMKEARIFFSRDTGSDTIASFHAYRMWLSLRDRSPESEELFLNESNISREALKCVHYRQIQLLGVFKAIGFLSVAGGVDVLPDTILQMPENALLQGHALLRCVSSALYPHCVVPHTNGTVSCLSASETLQSTTRSPTQFAVFAEQSVMSAKDVYQAHAERPFLYLRSSHTDGIMLLADGISLSMDAAVVCCGRHTEWVKPASNRCRGWSSVLTNAWRQTERARLLPPQSQLPEVSISIKPYDTVHAAQVILAVDDTFAFNMRSTSLNWLLQMREHCHRRVRSLVCDKSWPKGGDDASIDIGEAWDWWSRRANEALDWLREERAALNKDASTLVSTPLWPYYQFTTNPGMPEAVIPEEKRSHVVNSLFAEGDSCLGESASHLNLHQQQQQQQQQQQRSAVYVGNMPDAVMDKNIHDTASSIARARTREQEISFLKAHPDLFAFLDPEHEFHGYYLHVLRGKAPDLQVLGDDLEEVERFLKGLEDELRMEIGMDAVDTAAAEALQQDNDNTVDPLHTAEGTGMYQFQELNAEEEYMSSYGMQVETQAEHATKAPSLFKSNEPSGPAAAAASASAGAGGGGDSVLGECPNAMTMSTFFSAGDPASETHTKNSDEKSINISNSASMVNSTGGNIVGNVPSMEQGSALLNPPVNPNTSVGNFTFDKGGSLQASPPTVLGSGNFTSGPGGAEPTLMERLLAIKSFSGGGGPTTEAPSATFDGMPAVLSSQQMLTPSHVLPQQPYGMFSPGLAMQQSLQQSMAPSTAELLALMGVIRPPQPPPPTVNPLTIPPPPIPAEAVAERPASVLVYPLPSREFGNVPLILAKALGETMSVKVGPTRIVGNVARIDVPNHQVEARALHLKSFICVGKKVYIFKNDRILDNPDKHKPKHAKKDRWKGGSRKPEEEQEQEAVLYEEEPSQWNEKPQAIMSTGTPPPSSRKPTQIGLLTDSEDEDEDEDNVKENEGDNKEEASSKDNDSV